MITLHVPGKTCFRYEYTDATFDCSTHVEAYIILGRSINYHSQLNSWPQYLLFFIFDSKVHKFGFWKILDLNNFLCLRKRSPSMTSMYLTSVYSMKHDSCSEGGVLPTREDRSEHLRDKPWQHPQPWMELWCWHLWMERWELERKMI